jgi:hypothetical protein
VDGVYYMVPTSLTTFVCPVTDKVTNKVNNKTVHVMLLRVVGDQVYDQYVFKHKMWGTDKLAQFTAAACAARGLKPSDPVVDYEVLEKEVGTGVFEVQVERNKGKNGTVYVDLTVRRLILEEPKSAPYSPEELTEAMAHAAYPAPSL